MKSFSNATPSRGSDPRMEDLVDVIEWPKNKYMTVRMIGPIYAYANIWFTITTPKNPKQRIPKLCLDLDGDSDKMVTDICPYRKSGAGNIGKYYAINVIVRDLQEDSHGDILEFPKPNRPSEEVLGHKAFWAQKGDTRKTPVRILIVPESAVTTIKKLSELNRVKIDGSTKSFDLGDLKYGCDIDIMEDESKKGAAKFLVNKGDRTPITSEERRYLLYRPDLLKPRSLAEAKRDMAELEDKLVDDDKSDRKPAKGGKRRDEVDDDVMDMSDDDIDDRPARSKKHSRDEEDDEDDRSSRRKSRDDIDDDKPASRKRTRYEDDDEDERPSRKRNSRDDDEDDRPKSRSRRSREDEDEDSGDDDDLDADLKSLDDIDDDEDDRPARRRSRDDDEDDRPRSRRR